MRSYVLIGILFSAVQIACGIAILVRFRGSLAAVLGGVASGLFLLGAILPAILGFLAVRLGFTPPLQLTWVTGLAGLGCLLAAILVAPTDRGSLAGKAAAEPITAAGSGSSARRTAPAAVSKPFYLGSFLGAGGLSMLLSVISIMATAGGEEEVGLVLVLLAMPLLIYAAVVLMVLVHKMWAAIQDGAARTTPGKAVGFLFIPLFNLYWVFQAYWGWTKDFNAYVAERGIRAPRMPEGLAVTVCVLILCSLIPLVGMVVSAVNLVLVGVFLGKVCDGINALAADGR